MSAIRDVRSGRGALGGAVRLVLVVSPADDLAAQGALGCGRVVSADHGVELIVGDANRQEQVHVDAGVGELVEGRRAGAGQVRHLDGDRWPYQVLDVRALQRRLGGGLVVGDEGDDTAVAVRSGAQQKVDAATGHRLAQAGKLARLVVQLHGERAHLEPLSGKKASTATNPEPTWPASR